MAARWRRATRPDAVSATSEVVGGLVGFSAIGTVGRATPPALFRAAAYVGGLVGYNEATVETSYATGSVSAAAPLAG